jgi:leucyl-tRNA synthetase
LVGAVRSAQKLPSQLADRDDTLTVFTTRPDTLFGASFCAIAADHPLAQSVARTDPAVAAFVADCRLGATKEADVSKLDKKGHFTGLYAVHPFDGGRKLPIYIANFVLMDYGTGQFLAVPPMISAIWNLPWPISCPSCPWWRR